MQQIENLSKPFILLSLIGYFALGLFKKKVSAFGIFILVGLVLSLAGDVLLIFQETPPYFTLGLSSFLLAHIFYITAFTKTYLVNHEIKFLKKYGWAMLLVVAYGWFFFNAIKDFLGQMIGPVMIYTMVITLMLLIALNRFRKVSTASFLWISGGALLFVASDSLLAWSKFVRELEHSDLLIMLTYGLAQYGIVRGALIQIQDVSAKSIATQA